MCACLERYSGARCSACAPAYAGASCASCAPQHFQFAGDCRSCGDYGAVMFIPALLVYGLVVLVHRHGAGLRTDSLTTARMAVVRLQIVFVHLEFGLAWPPFVRQVASWMQGLFSFDLPSLASPECVVDGGLDAATRWSLTLWGPLTFALPFCAMIVGSRRSRARQFQLAT